MGPGRSRSRRAHHVQLKFTHNGTPKAQGYLGLHPAFSRAGPRPRPCRPARSLSPDYPSHSWLAGRPDAVIGRPWFYLTRRGMLYRPTR